ncbi:hypothetical protein [Arsenicicoccus dermatophilus]|uniref:hypothetical protein n=1 Tax=Arsenicicoccus dermatophilus TaxID=1076331 RepID=UPI001F4D29E9|nr:hypothetical protein [Arsenicicoccus dermatophilus]MCH8613450.1 hypothetical protein [Arsenicicoccus dermatophilus]
MTRWTDRSVVGVAALAAVIPTVLSAIGQVALWHDVVGLSLTAAVAFACFLETALIASALMARQAIQRGGAGRTDLAATWILSLLSGVLAAAHDVVTRHGDAPAMVALAAVARVVAPLVACWLWHRVVIGDRDDTGASWRATRDDARVLATAVAVQRARTGHGVWRAVLAWRGRRLVRVLGRDAADRVAVTLAGLDAIAGLPGVVVVGEPVTAPALPAARPVVLDRPVTAPDPEPQPEAETVGEEPHHSPTTPPPGMRAEKTYRVHAARDLITRDPDATSTQLIGLLAAEGITVKPRTAQRDMDDARALLARGVAA